MRRPDEPRSRLAIGFDWASRVTTVALEFALPPLFGAWADKALGVSPAGVLLGAALGFGVGMAHLLKMAREGAGPKG